MFKILTHSFKTPISMSYGEENYEFVNVIAGFLGQKINGTNSISPIYFYSIVNFSPFTSLLFAPIIIWKSPGSRMCFSSPL